MGETLEAGRDLDVIIAREVFDKKPCKYEIVARFSAWATGWKCKCKNMDHCYPEDSEIITHPHSPLAKYSTDFKAAWDVLTGIHSKFKIWRGLSSRSGVDFKLCRDYPHQDTYWLEYMTPGGLTKGPEVKSPEMAICLAALECVRYGKEGKKA